MRLLVFAHRGEANIFLSRLNLKAKNLPSLTVYENENTVLIITGEGTLLENAKSLY